MKYRDFWMVVTLVAFFVPLASAKVPVPTGPPSPAKVLVADGHVQHDLGNLWNNVTNFGLIGSQPVTSAPYGNAPSCRWPGADGVDQLYAAGLWVGALIEGTPHVSTGAYNFELQATEAPGDTIFPMPMMAPGGARYPAWAADDDGDGREDEDPANGLDDDGDGLIDEDFGGIGQQSFRCVYSDTAANIQTTYPDHSPLGISVIQESLQWDRPGTENFIGYDFTVTNVGTHVLEQVYLGMFADFDIGEGVASAENDQAGFYNSLVRLEDGSFVPVALAYTYDGTGYAGFVFCHSSGPDTGGESTVPSVQIFAGSVAFDNGGDPTNDIERYAILSSGESDPNTVQAADYRTLLTSGPFASLAPGQSLAYQVALVAAADFDGLLQAAGEAVLTYSGLSFDRDGDPTNGDEYHVPWLRPEDVPAQVLKVTLVPENPPVTIPAAGGDFIYNLAIENTTTEDILADVGIQAVMPDGLLYNIAYKSDVNFPAGETVIRTMLSQTVPAGAPEGTYTYSVKVGQLGSAVLGAGDFPVVKLGPAKGPDTGWIFAGWDMDSALNNPPVKVVLGDAYPNPFNPVTSIRIDLAEPTVINLRIFDLRGQLIRSLVSDRNLAAGTHTQIWRGDDDRGQTVGAGVYFYRLEAGNFQATKRITMIK